MTSRIRLLRAGLTITLVTGSVLLTGCTAIVPMEPATDAVNPTCADLIVRLPTTVASLPERETNAQSTGAWGTPSAVLLHCGVDVPAPTTLPCLTVNGIDWIEDDTDAPLYRYTTYGRDPATELVIDSDKVSGSTVLVDLANAVENIPATGKCLGAEDLLLPTDGETAAPAQ
ncbi:DUF3515 domain-containing protein [Cryobacterium sp. TmT2-59]|uniref:DUF3515 domain-containing protein n=1 Tax=Cryobacterium shii TaxID=1259235 RepID=A0AAQ2HE22_9MICO|nr:MULTISPECIES: DUF3515 domain-containing protein [Cryobacterium]TFC40981.1 DUF3515 domain-containing protein [Cryobacterium shii]TFC87786.1 DUF3515 domain-containing protein [Cryobacterium sp. TmT2-59]TFD19399.1 DUF3515 domain-containing protein [Cryobacterium sp. TMT2-23]TFD19901.1 DUF3515 domain-containing protein [Cryobacterium sp. TMT4-10]